MKRKGSLQRIVIAAVLVIGFGGGLPVLAAQAQQASPWKDRAEYDQFVAIQQAKDANQRIELVDKYLAAYPGSKVLEQIYAMKLQAYQQQQPNNTAKIEETATKLLEVNPKNFQALFLMSYLIPRTLNAQDASMDQKLNAAADYSARGLEQLAALQMPQGMAPADFEKQKNQSAAVFHQTTGFVALQKKEYEKAEESLRKSSEMNPNDGLGFYWLGLAYLSPPKPATKYDQGIWAMARAVSITGATALPAATQAQVKDYVTKVYDARHGSDQGLDQVFTQAASAPFPPADFHVLSLEETPEYKAEQEALRQEEAKLETARLAAERKQKLAEELTSFDVIVKYLQEGGQKGEDTWEVLHGQVLPLAGRVVDATVAGSRTVLLAVAPEVAVREGVHDVELSLAAPLREPLKKSQDIQFEGKLDTFRARPFLLKIVQGKVTP